MLWGKNNIVYNTTGYHMGRDLNKNNYPIVTSKDLFTQSDIVYNFSVVS